MHQIKHLFLFSLIVLGFAGCPGKGGGVADFTSELKDVTDEVAAKVDSNPTAAGVAEAARYYASKKPGLQEKWEKLKSAKMDEAAKNELLSKLVDSLSVIRGLTAKNLEAAHQDPAFFSELKKLQADFETTFNPAKLP